MVIKHETVHLIQDNLGVDSVLQEPLLSYLVRETLSERETLSVLVHYENSGYINGEFDARVLSRLPEPVIMTMYRLSKDYADLTSTR